MKEELYVSVDVETDGPIPGPHSMLSFGAASFTADGRMIGTFSRNLKTLDGAVGHPDTIAWWKTQGKAWTACRENQVEPTAAMTDFVRWLKDSDMKPVFVGYPAGFDFLFVYWYLIRFAGESPFSFSALDIKSYVMAVMWCDYRTSTKKNMPRRWFPDVRHNHVALDDAIEQGKLFINIMREHRFKAEPLR